MTVDIQEPQYLVEKVAASLLKNRILIAVGGGPGSGKSTVANTVCDMLNSRGINTVVVGMDGFHLTRDQLSASEDPKLAFKRRGAPFTFDANGFVDFVKRLRASCSGEAEEIKGPSFDHKIKDPEPNGITVPSDAKVVIIEGLYTLLDTDPWNQVPGLVDQCWFVDVDINTARDRVAKRHLQAGIEPDLDSAYARVDSNDVLNFKYVLEHKTDKIDYVLHT